MQKCLMGLLTAGIVLFAAAPANSAGLFRGRGHCGDCGDCGGCASPCAYETVMVNKTITVCVEKWEDKEIICKVAKLVPHEEVREHRCTIQVASYSDEVRKVTCYEDRTHEVECDVVCCRRVPVCVEDCCGCSHTCWQTVQEVHKVKRCVHECVPVQKEVTVRVCKYTPQEKVWTTKCTTYTCAYEDVKRMVKVCHLVPEERVVQVCERRPCTTCAAPCTTCAAPCTTCNSCCNDCGGCHERHHRHAGCCR